MFFLFSTNRIKILITLATPQSLTHILLTTILFLNAELHSIPNVLGYKHVSSYPYISGDTFREIANHRYDGESIFNPEHVTAKEIVFIQTDFLESFFTHFHPYIKSPYILITHNSDDPAPGSFIKHLDDKKIIAWFGQNPYNTHNKFFAIPIGLANPHWKHGNTSAINTLLNNKEHLFNEQKNRLLYLNFSIHTNPQIRLPVYQLFAQSDFCEISKFLSFKDYLKEMSQFKYTICPHGNGLDCHKTWEALLLGVIPVVKKSTIDVLYEDLPVLIVDKWEQATASFLEEQYKVMQTKTYNENKLYADYWINKIKNAQMKGAL